MMEVLESFDKLINALDSKYYSRLLSNLASIIYNLDTTEYPAKLSLESYLEETDYSDEEKAIIRYFIANPNIRPGVLATVYSRVIVKNFKVHYSVR